MARGQNSQRGNRMANEVQRQMMARLMTKNPQVRAAYYWYTRLRHGGYKSPYFIVTLAMGGLGLLGAGSAGCTGMFYAFYRSFYYY